VTDRHLDWDRCCNVRDLHGLTTADDLAALRARLLAACT
jgi:hypothetical protein